MERLQQSFAEVVCQVEELIVISVMHVHAEAGRGGNQVPSKQSTEHSTSHEKRAMRFESGSSSLCIERVCGLPNIDFEEQHRVVNVEI